MQDHRPLLRVLAGDAEVEALFTDAADLAAVLRFEAALAAAQAECGLVPPEAAGAIAAACAALRPDWAMLAEALGRDGVTIPVLVGQVRASVDERYRAFLHFGATSQDAVDTSLAIRLSQVAAILAGRLDGLLDALAELAGIVGSRPSMARTRLQRALPFTWDDRLGAWSRPLAGIRDDLAGLRPRLGVVQFGGPVGDRRGLDGLGDRVAAGLAERLGLAAAPAWHTDRTPVLAFGALAVRIAAAAGKIGLDAALLSQNEIGEVRLQGGGGSSSMPHKANPVKAEVLVAVSRHCLGLSGILAQASLHEYERSGSAWTLEWLVLPDLAVGAAACLRLVGEVLVALEVTQGPAG